MEVEVVAAQKRPSHPCSAEDGSIDMDGFVGGRISAINWQSDSLVFGIEATANSADIEGTPISS